MSHAIYCDWCGKTLKWAPTINSTRKPFEWLALNDGRHMCNECKSLPKVNSLTKGEETHRCDGPCQRYYKNAVEFDGHACSQKIGVETE